MTDKRAEQPPRSEGFRLDLAPGPPWPQRIVAWALLVAPVVYLTQAHRAVQQDDALIYLRYVRNLLAGSGLVYNEGSYYNGLTSPLHTYLLIAMGSLVEDLQRASTLLSGLFLALSALVFFEVGRREIGFAGALFAALLMGCSRYFYATFGMETTVFVFLVGVCLYLFDRQRPGALGVALALLILARPEGVFLGVALAIEHLRLRRPLPGPATLLLPAVVLGANTLFNLVYFGAPLPGTSSAKIYLGLSGYWGAWPTAFLEVGFHYRWYFLSGAVLFLAEAGMAVLGVVALRAGSLKRVALVFLALYTAFCVLSNLPNHPWYYAPYYVFGFLFTGAAVQWLGTRLAAVRWRWARLAAQLAMGVLLAAMAARNLNIARSLNTHNDRHQAYFEIGNWVREYTPADASLAAVEVGTLGWYSERRIIDILGLVTPSNARFIYERRLSAWLEHDPPDYVLTHDPPWAIETGIDGAVAEGRFVRRAGFPFEGYRLFVRKSGLGLPEP